MGRISVEVKLTNGEDIIRAEVGLIRPEEIRRSTVRGVVDTGTMRPVIPATLAERLGLPEMDEMRFRCADGRRDTRKVVENIRLELLDRECNFHAIVEPNRDTVLVGWMVLDMLDLVVDCVAQKLQPRNPNGIVVEI